MTTLQYPRAAFRVEEMTPRKFSEYWNGLPLAPILPGIAKLLMERVDEETPDAKLVHLSRDEDGEWSRDSGVVIDGFYLGNSEMNFVVRVYREGKESTEADYYQATQPEVIVRLQALMQNTVDGDDERWLLTDLNNHMIACWIEENDVSTLNRQLYESLPEHIQEEFTDRPVLEYLDDNPPCDTQPSNLREN
jgi:hypothetical protein